MIPKVAVTIKGERELETQLEELSDDLHVRLVARIDGFTQELLSRVQSRTPVKTGLLVSEETEREFSDRPGRIAGYVGIYAPGDPTKEYPKAATLEYGTDKPRRAFEKGKGLRNRFAKDRQRILDKLSRPVHIEAIRYLRDPIKDMEPEIVAGIQEDLAAATQKANS